VYKKADHSVNRSLSTSQNDRALRYVCMCSLFVNVVFLVIVTSRTVG